MNEDIKNKMKITLEQDHPNAYSTIREDLNKIHDKNIYWTNVEDTDTEFYEDPIQVHLNEITSRIQNLENFLGANYETDENGNFIGNPFDMRITRTEMGLMRRPIIDSHIPEFEAESDEIPSPEERLFELEKKFQYLQEEGLTNKISELESIIAQLKELEKDVKFEAGFKDEIEASRVTLSGEVKDTLNERLDEEFQTLHNLVKDANYLDEEGYAIQRDKTISGWTQDLNIQGRTDYNVVQGEVTSAQILPVTPDGVSGKPIRKLEVTKGEAVFVKSIQGYTYESLIDEAGFAEGEHESQHTPPRSVSYKIEDTKQGEIVSMRSIEGATIQNVATSSFPEDGVIMPFLPSDGEYSALRNEAEGEVSLGSIRGRNVKNEIVTGTTDVITVGMKPSDTSKPITFNSKTDIAVNSVKGHMVENTVIGESRSEFDMPVYEDLRAGDTVYVDAIEGKTVIDILATCDTTPTKQETTTLLDVKKTLSKDGIFVKEGKFRELTIYGRTMNNLGLKPKDEVKTVFSNSLVPMDILDDKEPTEITKIIVKGKTYDNVLEAIGETEQIESGESILDLYKLFVNSKYGIDVKLDTETIPSNIKIVGGAKDSKFVELKSLYSNGEYEGVHTIQPIDLASTDTMLLIPSEKKYRITKGNGSIQEGSLYSKDDIYFYSINEDGNPYKMPDGVRNMYNTAEQTESISIREITLDGNQPWTLKSTAQNKITTTVFKYKLPENVLLPAANNIMANFEFFTDDTFKKSVAGNEGTNKYEDEAISITADGHVELRISLDRIGGNKVENLYEYLNQHPITVKVQLEYPETSKVPYSEVIGKYDFAPTKPTNFHIFDGYKFELISGSKGDPCKINMTLPTYNRYPVPKGEYTIITKTGNYVNNVDCSVRGNYLIQVEDAIYVDTKEPEIMLLKGNFVGDTVIQSLEYDYIATKPPYNKDKKQVLVHIGDIATVTISEDLASGEYVEIKLEDKGVMTDTKIVVEGNESELTELEFTYNSLHKFTSDIETDGNGLTEYSVIDVLEDGKVNRQESFVTKEIPVEEDGSLLFVTKQMMHQPMLFKGNYLGDHFGKYFEGAKSVEIPCILRGLSDAYRDSYNYNTEVLTRYTSILKLDDTYEYEEWENGLKAHIISDGVSTNWFDNRALNEIVSPNADVVYINRDYIGIKTSESMESFKEKVKKEPVEVYFALLKPEEITKTELDKLDSMKLLPEYETILEYTGDIIEVDSIVPPTFKYKTRSHNYFENVNLEEKEYIMTSEYEGDGIISLCSIPVAIENIDKAKIDLRGVDLTTSNGKIETEGYTKIHGLSMYEDNGTFLYGLDDVTSIGDNGSIDIFTIGKNKINIHDFSHDSNTTIENDLMYITKKGSVLCSRADISGDKEYTFSFKTLFGSGLVSIKLDGINATDEPFKFEDGVFEISISDTNVLEVEIISEEERVIIVDMQLEEGSEITEFESYYRSGYSIKLDEPLLSFDTDRKDMIKVGVDSHTAIIERNVGMIITDDWYEDGDVYRYNLGEVQFKEFKCNYMKDTVISFIIDTNQLTIPKELFITLDLENQPITVLYPLSKTDKEIVEVVPL